MCPNSSTEEVRPIRVQGKIIPFINALFLIGNFLVLVSSLFNTLTLLGLGINNAALCIIVIKAPTLFFTEAFEFIQIRKLLDPATIHDCRRNACDGAKESQMADIVIVDVNVWGSRRVGRKATVEFVVLTIAQDK